VTDPKVERVAGKLKWHHHGQMLACGLAQIVKEEKLEFLLEDRNTFLLRRVKPNKPLS